MRQVLKVVLPALAAAVLFLVPQSAYAQNGNIAGVVRDASGGVLPGVTVEVKSPALIEKVRSATTDGSGRYQITQLPVGTYSVTFKLSSFATRQQDNVQITTDYTAPVNAEMKPGDVSEVVNVIAEAPLVDVTSAVQRSVFTGEELRDLPTQRNARDLAVLVPGIAQGAFTGICSGGVGIFCTPIMLGFNSHTSINDNDGINQGRLQVNGMTIGANGGGTSSYLADVANAQEITFTLSGGLGDSETGGAVINIIPRTGGNRYTGNFFTSYTKQRWFDENNQTRTNINVSNTLANDHDVSGAFGGPIIKDRLWFFSQLRHQGRTTNLSNAFRNLNAGQFGANYVPADGRNGRPLDQLNYVDVYKNLNTRLTVQATQRNKFDIFWDEQDVCFAPCEGIQTPTISVEAGTSVRTWPNHVAQLGWTNPLTNRILLDAGFSALMQHVDTSRHRFETNYPDIPRVTENGAGSLAGGTAGGGSIATGSQTGGFSNIDNYQSRASASYITGTHNVKLGYQGAYLMSKSLTYDNNLRLAYTYASTAVPTGGVTTGCNPVIDTSGQTNYPCGNTSLYWPEDPFNRALHPVPTSFTASVGTRGTDQTVWFAGFYLQDQWTMNRFTLNGALRYDNAQSHFAKTCVGPDRFVLAPYCVNDPSDPYYQAAVANAPAGRSPTEAGKGVAFQDITPRWGVAWDVFGTGKTSVKWNMGKYIGAAGVSGIYTAPDPSTRVTNTMTRSWTDDNGNRQIDCNFYNYAAQDNRASGGDRCPAVGATAAAQFGVSPYSIDASGNPIGLTTTQCGRIEPGIHPDVINYCNNAGQNLLNGWDKRRYEWQLGLGIQHELLPRLSAEVTYNRRWYGNQQLTDNVGQGCDLYSRLDGGTVPDPYACMAGAFDGVYPNYDFYSFTAPVDTRLSDGGGYQVSGISTVNQTAAFPARNAVTYTVKQVQIWRGVDTNFVLRARGGLRFSGGTSTGSQYTDNCNVMVDSPTTTVAHGSDPSCKINRPFQTNVRATASYTIPWVDVLMSTVFQYRPGPEISAIYTYNVNQVTWGPNSQGRLNTTAQCNAQFVFQSQCFFSSFGFAATTSATNLLAAGEKYGEGTRLFDLKFAKNIRFANKRVNVGMDIYNLFNSDAILGYNTTYRPQTFDANGNATSTPNPWMTPTFLTSPRFARFSVQFDF